MIRLEDYRDFIESSIFVDVQLLNNGLQLVTFFGRELQSPRTSLPDWPIHWQRGRGVWDGVGWDAEWQGWGFCIHRCHFLHDSKFSFEIVKFNRSTSGWDLRQWISNTENACYKEWMNKCEEYWPWTSEPNSQYCRIRWTCELFERLARNKAPCMNLQPRCFAVRLKLSNHSPVEKFSVWYSGSLLKCHPTKNSTFYSTINDTKLRIKCSTLNVFLR